MEFKDPDTQAGMTERELLDEILTLVVAGHETTASTLNWTWWLVSQHPEVERRLHEEQDRVGLLGAGATYADLERLPYTLAVLQEALRLYPPAWILTRRAIGPDKLGGYDVPPGTDVFLSPFVVHRHPAFWDNAERFDPERFEPGRERDPAQVRLPARSAPGRGTASARISRSSRCMLHLNGAARRFRLRPTDDGADDDGGTHQPAYRTRHPDDGGRKMIQYATLTEMLDARSRGSGAIGYLEGEGAQKNLALSRAAPARARHPAAPAAHRRAARRPADPARGQQRAVHRRLLGLPVRRHHPGPGRRRHQRRAQAEAAADREAARQPAALHGSQAARAARDVRRDASGEPEAWTALEAAHVPRRPARRHLARGHAGPHHGRPDGVHPVLVRARPASRRASC